MRVCHVHESIFGNKNSSSHNNKRKINNKKKQQHSEHTQEENIRKYLPRNHIYPLIKIEIV